MFHPGDVIGPYTLIHTLGRGAFGEVWLGERASSLLTTQVALKLPLDAFADLDLIRREAQVWLKASGHPNIVPVLDVRSLYGLSRFNAPPVLATVSRRFRSADPAECPHMSVACQADRPGYL